MTTARWSAGLETGNPVVDRQHRQLFEMVEEFERVGSDPSSALQVAERIMEHVSDHFASEDALMHAVDYPATEREEHMSDHLELKDRARALVLRLRMGEDFDPSELVEYLSTWLVRHTTTRDMGLVRYISERS